MLLLWCYEGCCDLKSYQMNGCDLPFTLISLGVLWWKVSVLVMFSSFLTYQSWFNKAFFSWTRAASLLGPRALSSEAWLLDSVQSKWFLFPQTHSCGNKCLPVDSFSFFPSTANQSFPLYADKWTANHNSSLVLLC